eukprot:COSAG05_NODE_61_length_23137_cov_22.080693_13_plen_69_part_00
MLGPSTAIWLRKMIVPNMPGGRAPLESGLGAKPSYAGVTIAILGDYFCMVSAYDSSARKEYGQKLDLQ